VIILLHVICAIVTASLLAGAALLLRRSLSCPVARYRLDVLTLGLLLVLPAAQVALARADILPRRAIEPADTVVTHAPAVDLTLPLGPTLVGRDRLASTGLPELIPSHVASTPIVPVYAGIVGIVLIVTFSRLARSARSVRRATPVRDAFILAPWRAALRDMSLGRPVRLLESALLTIPAAWALGRRAVVLPRPLGIDDPAQVRCVLVHELTHLVRRDHWVLIAQHVVLAMYWISPVAWWLHRVTSIDRELSCDAIVVRRTASPNAYAHALLAAAAHARRPMHQLGLATSMAGPSSLRITRRITMLATAPTPTSLARQLVASATVVALGAVGIAATARALPLNHPPDRTVLEIEAPNEQPDIQVALLRQAMLGRLSGGAMVGETVLSGVATELRDGRLVAEHVNLNLPEQSKLKARLSGEHLRLQPAESATRIDLTDAQIEVIDPDGRVCARVTVGPSVTLHATLRLDLGEFAFTLEATDSEEKAAPVTIELSLPEPEPDRQEWLRYDPDEEGRTRIKYYRRSGHPLSGAGERAHELDATDLSVDVRPESHWRTDDGAASRSLAPMLELLLEPRHPIGATLELEANLRPIEIVSELTMSRPRVEGATLELVPKLRQLELMAELSPSSSLRATPELAVDLIGEHKVADCTSAPLLTREQINALIEVLRLMQEADPEPAEEADPDGRLR
jgi:beta-lactamase regulating signal transducer with metallopeptidase domain